MGTKDRGNRDRNIRNEKVKNPNKRLCIARNITFPVQKENDYWLMSNNKKVR